VRGLRNRRSNAASVNFGVASPVRQNVGPADFRPRSCHGRGLDCALAGSRRERDGCACCARPRAATAVPAIRAMAATSPMYSASSFAMNAVMSAEFMAMRHGGCVALIRSSMRSQRGDHGGNVIEIPSEPVGEQLQMTSPPLKPCRKYCMVAFGHTTVGDAFTLGKSPEPYFGMSL
jgi:hypothetical protein